MDRVSEPWHREIVELHEFFEELFLGTTDSLARADAALAAIELADLLGKL